jgi:glycosyltransferase involved in cell wall biosynthesis
LDASASRPILADGVHETGKNTMSGGQQAAENGIVADVAFILEGTYPYVQGGVSSWVDQIIKGLPDVSFALYFIGSDREQAKQKKYQLPPNVVNLTETFLHEKLPEEELRPAKCSEENQSAFYLGLAEFYAADGAKERTECFWELLERLEVLRGEFTFGNLLSDTDSWELLKELCTRFSPHESFIDFFWTARFLHLPMWRLWMALEKVPRARVIHSASAGYAGLVAAISSRRQKVPFLLTEHGIYTKERIAEISQADWIYEGFSEEINFHEGLGKLKQLWIGFFKFQGLVAYETAAKIITLYEGNVATQIEFGAPPEKTSVIPNGIDPGKFDGIRDLILKRWNPEPEQKYVGFIGRVVPIKDVKTLLRAARLVCEKCPNVEFLMAGPYEEDLGYFEECQKIVKLLDIEDQVKFLGMQKLMEILPRIDVMVLTSISEGLPLVILEAHASGIPVVATDVGACRELIFGRVPEDRALGTSGRVTKILSPPETASALLSLLQNPREWRRAGEAGRRRVEDHYTMSSVLEAYRHLYNDSGAVGGFVAPPPQPKM